MAEHATERARFTEMRARALTNVLLSGREDLLVQDQSGFDYGIDYLVTLLSDKPGLRQFAVELRATYSPVTADTANKVLEPALQGMARFGPFPYPTTLFYFTMMEPQSWYTWVMEPAERSDGTMALEMREKADSRPLNEETLDDIIARVHRWYDFSFGTKLEGKVARPARTTKSGAKAAKSEVVITETDSVTFDYSEALLQAPEQLAAARRCSSYIVKTHPNPLPTVTGWWDLEEDRRKIITLMITDSVTRKSATMRFTLRDVQNPGHVYRTINEHLGQILRPG
ncbi:MAG TPA: hypothetical protein VMV10_02595 [Pirellulales bacterium]|nr:hypothetical protein [Pirellulales bacterium]HVA45495.1 hypothetical protein [Pirellulales bacterium]